MRGDARMWQQGLVPKSVEAAAARQPAGQGRARVPIASFFGGVC